MIAKYEFSMPKMCLWCLNVWDLKICVFLSCLFRGIVISMGLNLASTAVKSALEVI
jgi:hypothetical protein